MKKRISLFISLLLILALCGPIGISSGAANMPISENQIIQDITTAVSQFYYCKDIYRSSLASDIFSSDIASYLSGKIEAQRHVTDLYNTNKENYFVDVKLLSRESTVQKNVTSYNFQVITTYNYVGRDFDTTSSEVVEILYDCNLRKIVDFYTPMNYYDEYVRPEKSSLSKANSSTQNKFELTSSITDKQASILTEIDSTFDSINNEIEFEEKPIKAVNSSTLNSTAIVNWARNNYNKNQPASGNGSVSYYDFSEISGNYDCTNFVSHAVLAGGAKINDTGNSGISSTGWYFRNINNRSSSWSGANYFYNYMTTNTTSNTAAGTSHQYSLNGAYWGRGDVMQFKFSTNSNYSHSAIITIKERSSDGSRYYAYVTGRTSDTQYNNNQAASDMAPSGMKRTIYVYNK